MVNITIWYVVTTENDIHTIMGNHENETLRETVPSYAGPLNGPIWKQSNVLLSFVKNAMRAPRRDPLRSPSWRGLSPRAGSNVMCGDGDHHVQKPCTWQYGMILRIYRYSRDIWLEAIEMSKSCNKSNQNSFNTRPLQKVNGV